MSNFIGKKYKQVSSENLDDFFKKLGLNFMLRKLILLQNPTYSLEEKDGVYTLTTVSMRTQSFEFKLGEEFEQTYPDGNKRMTLFTLEGNVLKQHQMGEPETFTTYTFGDTDLSIELKVGDITASRQCKIME